MGKDDDHWHAWKHRERAPTRPQRVRRRAKPEPSKPADDIATRFSATRQTPRGIKPSGDAVKRAIKLAILSSLEISCDEIIAKLGEQFGSWGAASKVTVSNIRADFRHSLKLIKEYQSRVR
jgi:hypothetical protein